MDEHALQFFLNNNYYNKKYENPVNENPESIEHFIFMNNDPLYLLCLLCP